MAKRGAVPTVGVVLLISGLFAYGDAGAAPFAKLKWALEVGVPGSDTSVLPASFWGEPYPYGYRYQRRQCVRHVLVETPAGPRWQTFYVCR